MIPVSKNNKASEPVTLRPLLICSGQFLVVAPDAVTVHVLTLDGTRTYYDGMTIAEQCTRRDVAVDHVYRSTFGIKGVIHALPAFNADALTYYTEHYDGPQQDAVRGLAACILTGVPFGPDKPNPDPLDGTPDRIPPRPPVPSSPNAAQEELLTVA